MSTFFLDNFAGLDSNPGNLPNRPWKTVAPLIAAGCNPGDTFLFHRGGMWDKVQILMDGPRGDNRPVTFGSYGSGKKPIISGGQWDLIAPKSSTVYGLNPFKIIRRSNVVIKGLKIVNAFSSCVYVDAAELIGVAYTITPITNIKIIGCDVSGAANDNILFIHGVSNSIISRTISWRANDYGTSLFGGSQVATGIEIADGGTGNVIEGCYINNCPTGISIHCHPLGGATSALMIAAPNGFPVPGVTIKDTYLGNNGKAGSASNGLSIAQGLNATNPNTGLANPNYGTGGGVVIQRCDISGQSLGSGLAIGRDSLTADVLHDHVSLSDVFIFGGASYDYNLDADNLTVSNCIGLSGHGDHFIAPLTDPGIIHHAPAESPNTGYNFVR